jgi:hypothetical protein
MNFGNLPFTSIDWTTLPVTEQPGSTGVARRQTFEAGAVRVRMVEYSAGYSADHWCDRGHVLLVLEGELLTELQDGRLVKSTAGMTYQVADGVAPHRSRTSTGARLFIVD